ncbi:MAG TPA: endonuclease/exonuclease/phosphatase family protein, partial [Pyrinomonadaceae bacterium]|nr:endonuclease/exonuclease/phosphatase family protein [Pyrinomonadaceae bacterium]
TIEPHTAADTNTALHHSLTPFFPELARFSTTKAMMASALYARLRPEIERVLGGIMQENFAPASSTLSPLQLRSISATAWNIERGSRFEQLVRVFKEHERIRESDVLLLTELDYGMARSGNRFVARELAERLEMNYVFAPCYLALNKGSGVEKFVDGENTLALHGNAVLSRYPLLRAHQLALPNGKDLMQGAEKRLGSQRTVIADMEHPLGRVRLVSLHLDAHSTQRHRHHQMKLVLDHLDSLEPQLPVLIGGDLNTQTYNSSRAVYSILGFFRRTAMGVRHVIENHYPYPDRWFERHLFRELERRGYDYRSMNEPGVCTLHYDVKDLAVNTNIGDWVPQWCFWFINRALEKHEGRCSFKLDWFTGRGLTVDPSRRPEVIGDLRDEQGPLSDHDAIVLDFVPSD